MCEFSHEADELMWYSPKRFMICRVDDLDRGTLFSMFSCPNYHVMIIVLK